MKKILMSVLAIGVVGAAVAYGTGAFFSDTETSTGNTFQTGAIDLKVASTAMYNGNAVTGSTWTLKDLNPTSDKFFNFADLKPGDYGENVIELTVQNNEAFACLNIYNVFNDDPTLTEPESSDGDTTLGVNNGELASKINYQLLDGASLIGSGTFSNFLTAYTQQFAMNPGDVVTPKTYTIKWCYGDWNPTSGMCDGSAVDNITQTDLLTADVSFYVVQKRHNEQFTCPLASNTRTITSNNLQGWFFYNDENDVIDNALGSFVVGPATPPLGTGSVQISVLGTQRRNLATYQFSGTPLANITTMSYNTYNPSAGNGGSANRSGYLQFNVDFNGSDTWQRRLIFLPSDNGAIVQNSWQTWNAINGGAALWRYSGATWPVTGQPGTTPKTWTQILADYPGVRIRVTDAFWGVRVGEPYPDGYTENLDNFVFGVSGVNTTYNFDN